MSYKFTVKDWTTVHIPSWELILKNYDPQSALHILEVGCFEGRSTTWFIDNFLHHPDSTITCVDSWKGGEEVARSNLGFDFSVIKSNFIHNVENSKYPNKVKVLEGNSREQLAKMLCKEQHLDFAYIDGSHQAKDVLYDAMFTFHMLKPSGTIIFDDYRNAMATKDPALRVQFGVDTFALMFNNELSFGTTTKQAFIVKNP